MAYELTPYVKSAKQDILLYDADAVSELTGYKHTASSSWYSRVTSYPQKIVSMHVGVTSHIFGQQFYACRNDVALQASCLRVHVSLGVLLSWAQCCF